MSKKNHVFVRPCIQEDAPLFTKWMVETKDNLADPEVLTYRTTSSLCAYNKERGPIVFVPVQHPFMMESLAINPEASPTEVAMALKALVQSIVTQMHIQGVGELYFSCREDSTQKFAESQCFERVPWAVYRLKLSQTEPGNGE